MGYGFYFNDSYYAILGQLRSDLSRWRVIDRVCKFVFWGEEDKTGLNKKEINAFEFLKKKVEGNGGGMGLKPEKSNKCDDGFCLEQKENTEIYEKSVGFGDVVVNAKQSDKNKNFVMGENECEAGNIAEDLVSSEKDCVPCDKDNQEIVGGGIVCADNENEFLDSEIVVVPNKKFRYKPKLTVAEIIDRDIALEVNKNEQKLTKMGKNGQKRAKSGKNGQKRAKSVTHINIEPYKIKIKNINLKKLKEKEYKEKEKEEILESESENIKPIFLEDENILNNESGVVECSNDELNNESERLGDKDSIKSECGSLERNGRLKNKNEGSGHNDRLDGESEGFDDYRPNDKDEVAGVDDSFKSESKGLRQNKMVEGRTSDGVELLDIEKYILDNSLFVDAKAFYYFYKSKGWKVGGSKLIDWRAKCKEWHYRKLAEKEAGCGSVNGKAENLNFGKQQKDVFRCGSERDYSGVDLNKLFCDLDKIEL